MELFLKQSHDFQTMQRGPELSRQVRALDATCLRSTST